MNKEAFKKKIYDLLLEQGQMSTRDNVMEQFTADKFENKIYVKKYSVDIPMNGTALKMISIASDDADFTNDADENIRFGFVNSCKVWTNLFIDELTPEMRSTINKRLFG